MNNKELKIKKLINEYNECIEKEIFNSIPKELMNNTEFMDYMINGKYITMNYNEYPFIEEGHTVYKIKNIKDAEKIFGTNHDEIIQRLDNEILKTIAKGYIGQKNDYMDYVVTLLISVFNSEEEENELNNKNFIFIIKNFRELNLLQLMWLNQYLDVEYYEYDNEPKNILNGVVSYLMKELKGGNLNGC